MEHDPTEVKIPKIQLEWKEKEGVLVAEEIVLDLGILGKFTLGPFSCDMDEDEPMTLEEREDTNKEVQVAFARLLCRFAACSVVELDLEPNMLLGWYQHFREKLKGDATIFHAVPELEPGMIECLICGWRGRPEDAQRLPADISPRCPNCGKTLGKSSYSSEGTP